MKGRWLARTMSIGILAVVLIGASQSAFGQGSEIGFVANIRGVWIDALSANQPLSPYSTIRSGTQIRSKERKGSDGISLRIYGIAEVVEFRCTTPAVCDRTLDLAPVMARRDPALMDRFATVIAALQTVIGNRAIVQRQFLGRAFADVPPGTAVVAEDKRFAPRELLAGLPTGPLVVNYRAISADRGAGAVVSTGINWSGGPALPLELERGLYEMQVSAATSAPTRAPASNDGLVLVVSRAEYPRAQSLLSQGESYLATLHGIGPVERSTLLSYLMLSFVLR
jgi:hypothetical protein